MTGRAFLVRYPGLVCRDCTQDIPVGVTAVVTSPGGQPIYRCHRCARALGLS